MPYHLLYPLFSSVTFVFGVMLVKQGISRGASPWTPTFVANLWLAIVFGAVGFSQGEMLPTSGWWPAAAIGLCFVLGQLFTYLAFQLGDVSVATPVFGVKVLIVAVLMALVTGEIVPARIWSGAILAASGVALVQSTGLKQSREKRRSISITIGLVMTAALMLSLFDIALQHWGPQYRSTLLLPAMFAAAFVLSLGFLPWVDSVKSLRKQGAFRWILAGTLLMALQAVSMSWSLSRYGDAARINIVYSLRSLWGVLIAWSLAHLMGGAEAEHGRRIMLTRLAGAVLLTGAVVLAITA